MSRSGTISLEHKLFSSLPSQVLSPLTKNLFQRAISESGVALTPCLFRETTRRAAEVGHQGSKNLQGKFPLSYSGDMP